MQSCCFNCLFVCFCVLFFFSFFVCLFVFLSSLFFLLASWSGFWNKILLDKSLLFCEFIFIFLFHIIYCFNC